MFARTFSFLSSNRYTLSLAIIGCVFLFSSCIDSVESFIDALIGAPSGCTDELLFPSDREPASNSPITFERNLGQTDSGYDFLAYNGPATLLLGGGNATVRIRATKLQPGAEVSVSLEGANKAPAEGLDPLTQRTNYLLGRDASKWITNVPNFRRVRYANVYPGIDVVYYGFAKQLEHDFVVSPGADPSRIRMVFSGADSITSAADGSLQLHTRGGSITWKKPDLYQDVAGGRRRIEGRYRMGPHNTVAFETGPYDITKPLVIDPAIAYATYYGGRDSESAARVAVDASGNIYFTGGTSDAAFLVSPGAFSSGPTTAYSGDAIVVKMAADGKSVVYTTHIGGSDTDIGLGIAVDSSSNIYITGSTLSTDYPVSANAFRKTKSDSDPADCFVTKLNAAGNAIVYSTLLGGSSAELCTGIGIDGSGNAYIAGGTASQNFPTVKAFQSSRAASNDLFTVDAFVTKLSADGSQLLYSTYAGGSKNDAATAIAVDSAGNAYVTGGTTSSDFPVTAGALQTTFSGAGGQNIALFAMGDAFVMKLDPSGRQVYSTYLGGSGDDAGIGIAIDSAGNAYVAGSTISSNFPLKGAFQTSYKGAGGEVNLVAGDGFVAKINPQGSALVYSSYIGGSQDDRVAGIAVDSSGNVFITGNTLSSDFPVTADARQPKYAGQAKDAFRTGDAFFAQISPVGALTYSSYLGGSGSEWGVGVAVDSQGGIIVSGGTNSSDFPTTTGAYQVAYGGGDPAVNPGGDAFIVKLGATTTPPAVSISGVVNAASYAGGSVSPGEIVTLAGVGIGPATLQNYDISSGQFATEVANTRVLFDGVPAPIIYVWSKQTAVVAPYGIAGKAQTQIVVEYNGQRSAPVTMPVTQAVPGLFAADASGSGQGAILNLNYSYNSASNPAPKGGVVLLFGTGEGQTDPPGADGIITGSVLPKPLLTPKVTIGTETFDPLYAGAAPGLVSGMFQVNITIPCDAPTGNVPVVVQFGSFKSQGGLTVAVRDATASDSTSCKQ